MTRDKRLLNLHILVIPMLVKKTVQGPNKDALELLSLQRRRFKEWDELKRFDVVFLVHAKQDAKHGDAKNVEYIRGAEIIDIRDEEGVPANQGFPNS